VPLQTAPGRKAVLEQTGEQWLFGRKGGQAIADVARGEHPQFPPENTAAAAVVSDGDDGGDVAAVTLQAA
jgi:hypothetical protein